MERNIEIKLTAKEVAEQLWHLGSDEQAEMFEELFKLTGGSHLLMMQFLMVRDDCKERSPEALECFQTMFASAFKYMVDDIYI